MTEEEAKTKWCPHVRHMVWPSPDGPSGGNQPKDASLCIGSECMMWVEVQFGGMGHCGLINT